MLIQQEFLSGHFDLEKLDAMNSYRGTISRCLGLSQVDRVVFSHREAQRLQNSFLPRYQKF